MLKKRGVRTVYFHDGSTVRFAETVVRKQITIADILRVVKYKPETENGICTQQLVMQWLNPDNYELMKSAMCDWPKSSGCRVYPVPASNKEKRAGEAQIEFSRRRSNGKSLWDSSTEYGALRYELLDFLIKHPSLQRPLYKQRTR